MDHQQEYSHNEDQHSNNVIGGSYYRTVENDNSAVDMITTTTTTTTIAATSTTTTAVEQCENDSVNKPCLFSFTSMSSSLPTKSSKVSSSSSKSSFSILNELPIEILRDYILYPFCDGKTLSTLSFTLLLNCNNIKDDEDNTIISSCVIRNYHLV